MKKQAMDPLEPPLWLPFQKLAKAYVGVLAHELRTLAIDRHFFLLAAIHQAQGKATQQALANLLGTDKVAMVGILDYLGDKGYVRRVDSEEDRRKHAIVLTPKGERAVPAIRAAISKVNAKALEGLPKALMRDFQAVLAKMDRNLQALPSRRAPRRRRG